MESLGSKNDAKPGFIRVSLQSLRSSCSNHLDSLTLWNVARASARELPLIFSPLFIPLTRVVKKKIGVLIPLGLFATASYCTSPLLLHYNLVCALDCLLLATLFSHAARMSFFYFKFPHEPVCINSSFYIKSSNFYRILISLQSIFFITTYFFFTTFSFAKNTRS